MRQLSILTAGLLAAFWFVGCQQAFAECGFAGSYTANSHAAHGTLSNEMDISGAHRSLPPGSRVVVRNQRKGRSILVRIIQRGLSGLGEIINLSAGAMQALGIEASAPVCVEVVTYGSEVRGYSWAGLGRRHYVKESSLTRLAYGGRHRRKIFAGVRIGRAKRFAKVHRRGHQYVNARGVASLAHGGYRRKHLAGSGHRKGKRYAEMHRRGHLARRSTRRRHAA
jgi:rare lipoprotein A